jgi:hypothetical protein
MMTSINAVFGSERSRARMNAIQPRHHDIAEHQFRHALCDGL